MIIVKGTVVNPFALIPIAAVLVKNAFKAVVCSDTRKAFFMLPRPMVRMILALKAVVEVWTRAAHLPRLTITHLAFSKADNWFAKPKVWTTEIAVLMFRTVSISNTPFCFAGLFAGLDLEGSGSEYDSHGCYHFLRKHFLFFLLINQL